ncbi:unnamed protein product [Lepeophtheirus salmonis]|uniref:(salmon louse) hypothetical protein n=1 Tax=Lepeophtheirus salmonis TaxID=72036 RepID=A0A7R8D2P6_LEPSM|nr:unnamed protein product [Lepeophtheirus salmonis]CAF3007620.1 unnamed protein product [Lepeophtheirus salmonis]
MKTEFKFIFLTLIIVMDSIAIDQAAYHYKEYEGFILNMGNAKTVDLQPEDLPSHILCGSVCLLDENCGYFSLVPSDPKKCFLIQPVSSGFIQTSDSNDRLLIHIKYPIAFKESKIWFNSIPNPMLRVKIFNQELPNLFLASEINYNQNNPATKKYSILGYLDDLCKNSITEQFYFYLCYPEFADNLNATHRYCSSWIQTSNPLDTINTVTGFKKVSFIFHDVPYFRGLARSDLYKSILDADNKGWHFAIGTYEIYYGKIPLAQNQLISIVELYCIAEPANIILFNKKHGLDLEITNIS